MSMTRRTISCLQMLTKVLFTRILTCYRNNMARKKSKSKKARSCGCKGQTISQKVIIGGHGGGGATAVYATYANPFYGSVPPMLPPSFPTDLGGGFDGRDQAGRTPRDDLQYGSEASFVSTRTKMSSASQLSTDSVSPLHRFVFNDAQQNVPLGLKYAESVAESVVSANQPPGSDSSMVSAYRPPSLVESRKSVESKKKPIPEGLVGVDVNTERSPFPFTAIRNPGETSRRRDPSRLRQVFDPNLFDSLGRARRITEDGEVVDVTPAPPLVDLC